MYLHLRRLLCGSIKQKCNWVSKHAVKHVKLIHFQIRCLNSSCVSLENKGEIAVIKIGVPNSKVRLN